MEVRGRVGKRPASLFPGPRSAGKARPHRYGCPDRGPADGHAYANPAYRDTDTGAAHCYTHDGPGGPKVDGGLVRPNFDAGPARPHTDTGSANRDADAGSANRHADAGAADRHADAGSANRHNRRRSRPPPRLPASRRTLGPWSATLPPISCLPPPRAPAGRWILTGGKRTWWWSSTGPSGEPSAAGSSASWQKSTT